MTKPKSQQLGAVGSGALVYWDDELVPEMPDLSSELDNCLSAVSVVEFTEWLRQRLARYRVSERARAEMGQRLAIVQWIEAAATGIDEALDDGRLNQLPAFFAEPAIEYAAMKAGAKWRELLASRDASAIADVLRTAAADLRKQKSNRGRPRMTARDQLLAAIMQELRRLGMRSADAAGRADSILIKCKVPSAITHDDADHRSLARAARRVRKP